MASSQRKRLMDIGNLLQKNGFVEAAELSQRFGVSMETIRKDLLILADRGIAEKAHGGATLASNGSEMMIDYRLENSDRKNDIARYAVEMSAEAKSLFLDSGSTCLSCVRYLNLLPSKDIFTNSLYAFQQLDGDLHNVFLLPGKKREKNQSVIGNWAEDYISRIQIDTYLMGTAGLFEAKGPTSHSYHELSLKQMIIERSEIVFVLADSSKFKEKGLHTVTSFEKIDGIITDSTISKDIFEKCSKLTNILIAEA